MAGLAGDAGAVAGAFGGADGAAAAAGAVRTEAQGVGTAAGCGAP